jgi:hypothetical protein
MDDTEVMLMRLTLFIEQHNSNHIFGDVTIPTKARANSPPFHCNAVSVYEESPLLVGVL